MKNHNVLLIEPVSKTPYPPLGLMRISSMLKSKYNNINIKAYSEKDEPSILDNPDEIYVTSLFTWDLKKVCESINYLKYKFPSADIKVGGVSASLLPSVIQSATGITPHKGILEEAELYAPDYSLTFGRKLNTSISFTSKGCKRKCKFCCVTTLEPKFKVREHWINDINPDFNMITFWDNNWLASPNIGNDVEILERLGKKVDFNQGLDARFYTKKKAELLSRVHIDPLRFAFDNIEDEADIVKAITLAKQYTKSEIRVYVLYNYTDSPDNFFHRINVLNKLGVLSFPMEYRSNTESIKKYPNQYWDSYLLRALKLSLMFYYRKGMITQKRDSFTTIYGNNAEEFKRKLYDIYEYDLNLRRKNA